MACTLLLLGAGIAYLRLQPGPGCGVRDHVAVIDQTTERSGRSFWLVHRVAGIHKKVEIIEVYAAAPVFDACSRSEVEPLTSDTYDPGQGFAHGLVWREGQIAITYTVTEGDAVKPSRLRLPKDH
jgi:hypothetical protein